MTRKELALQVGVQVIVAGVAAFIVHYSSVHDTEVWNGNVVRKASEQSPARTPTRATAMRSAQAPGRTARVRSTATPATSTPTTWTG